MRKDRLAVIDARSRDRRRLIRSTTVLCVRLDDKVVMAGDGQVTLGESVIKHGAKKIRRLYQDKILAGFAGSTADAFTLFSRFEAKLEQYHGNLGRAAVELAQRLAHRQVSAASGSPAAGFRQRTDVSAERARRRDRARYRHRGHRLRRPVCPGSGAGPGRSHQALGRAKLPKKP